MNVRTGQCEKVNFQGIAYSRYNQGDILGGDNLSTLSPSFMPKNCLQMTDIQQSNRNVFITLQASPEVYQAKDSDEPGFIDIVFPNISVPVSYYCNRCTRDKTIFECLLLFASGLPSGMFSMQVSCQVAQSSGPQECKLTIPYKTVR